MKRAVRTFGIIATLTLTLAGSALAQSADGNTNGAGRWELSAFPGGGVFFTKGDNANAPDFGEYALGASATFNANRWIGIEGELGGGVSVNQDLAVGPANLRDAKVPHTLAYNGNLVVNPFGSDRGLVPYVTAGAGGLTLLSRQDVTSLGVEG